MRQNLPGYTVVGCGRKADYSDEAMTLAIRNETAELLGFEVFWLSPTPDQPGSRYAHQSECPRTCAAAIVNVQGMGGPIRIYNTHLDHLDPESRRLGLETGFAPDGGGCRPPSDAGGAAGGFQCRAGCPGTGSPEAKDPAAGGCGTSRKRFPSPSITFTADRNPSAKLIISLSHRNWLAGKVERWMDSENGVYLSDHCPICAELWRQPQE